MSVIRGTALASHMVCRKASSAGACSVISTNPGDPVLNCGRRNQGLVWRLGTTKGALLAAAGYLVYGWWVTKAKVFREQVPRTNAESSGLLNTLGRPSSYAQADE